MSQVAFALRADVDGDTFAGSVALSDGKTYDVGDALAKGKGTIVSDDAEVISALDGYVPLKRTTVPDKARKDTPAQKAADPGTSGAGNEASTGGEK